MARVVILGNSGSGKTTLARSLAESAGLAHLDLDDVAWKEADPPVRRALGESRARIDEFIDGNVQGWIIEGCYGSLVAHAAQRASQMIFLNIGIEACVENCKSRPWEPEKYPST